MAELLPADVLRRLQANGVALTSDPFLSPWQLVPVVRLYRTDRMGEWFLIEQSPGDPDRAAGLYRSQGCGRSFYSPVFLSHLAAQRDTFGRPVQRDRYFHARGPLSTLEDWWPRTGD